MHDLSGVKNVQGQSDVQVMYKYNSLSLCLFIPNNVSTKGGYG